MRVRPLLRDERERSEPVSWLWEDDTITQARQGMHDNISSRSVAETHPRDTYRFDHLFTPEHSNLDIYESAIHPIVCRVMEGLHGSIFTYGQTSSGKTFTMNGSAKQPGIIPQTIYDLFNLITTMSDREFLFRVSYLEIYNETVSNLTCETSNPRRASLQLPVPSGERLAEHPTRPDQDSA